MCPRKAEQLVIACAAARTAYIYVNPILNCTLTCVIERV